jgi:site-specific DNA-methyltransferase (adenine-specific)
MRAYYEDDVVAIYHGDCREILPELPRVDLVLTDPPWGIGYDTGGRREATTNPQRCTKHIAPNRYGVFTWDYEPFDPASILALETNAIVWGGDNFASKLTDGRAWLCWVKVNGSYSHLRQGDMELAWTNCVVRPRVFNHLWMGFLRESESGVSNYHPTQKPVALMRWCIGLVKNVGSVLDPYMGSGTTLRAAKDLGIRAIGIEINEAYCEVAAKRMAQEVFQFNGLAKIESKGPELFVI